MLMMVDSSSGILRTPEPLKWLASEMMLLSWCILGPE
jgi:hypothetical protein